MPTHRPIPERFSTNPEDVRRSASTLRGWRQFVNSVPHRPELLTRDAFNAKSGREQSEYNSARARYHRALKLIRHQQLETIWAQIDDVVDGADADDGAGIGIALTGGTLLGKSTTIMGYGKRFERQIRADYPEAFDQPNAFVPVAYTSLLAGSGLRANMRRLLSFYGEPYSTSETGTDLMRRLTQVMLDCQTKLLILDQAQSLEAGRTSDDEVAEHLKNLMDDSRAVIALVGTSLHVAGPVAPISNDEGGYHQQLANRFMKISVTPLPKGPQWDSLLATAEDGLVLFEQHEGDLVEHLSDPLWEWTQGSIGYAMNTIKTAAQKAIRNGTEKIDEQVLREAADTVASEAAATRQTTQASTVRRAPSRTRSAPAPAARRSR